jgi:hypothetical protein
MNPIRTIIFLGFIAFSITSCKDDKEDEPTPAAVAPKANLVITPVYGDQPFNIGTVYTTSQGYRLRVETMKTYMANIQLHTITGDSTILKDILVHDFSTPLQLNADIKEGSYNKIKMSVGVPSELNKDQDPSQYANSHPLSVQGSSGMFWTWNTGYIFTKFDGRLDLSGQEGAQLIDPFAFHTGDDLLYRTIELPIDIAAEDNGSYTIQVKMDIRKFIENDSDPIDLSVDYLTHTVGNMNLARRFVENVALSFEVE